MFIQVVKEEVSKLVNFVVALKPVAKNASVSVSPGTIKLRSLCFVGLGFSFTSCRAQNAKLRCPIDTCAPGKWIYSADTDPMQYMERNRRCDDLEATTGLDGI